MKKVISAMTAAVMTASAFASVISASAVYSGPDDVGFYLKAIPGDGYTVSEDGKTVTFASAADAAGKTVDIQHFIVADTKDPSIKQFTYMVASSNEAMVHSPSTILPLKNPAYGGEVREYTANGETFETDMFVTPFGYFDILGDYSNDTGSYVESNTSAFLWEYDDAENDALIVGWMYGASNTDYANYANTAAFMTDKSDDFPTSQFAFTIDDAIVDGTYTIDFADGYTDKGQPIPDDPSNPDGPSHYSFTNGNTINAGPTPASEIIPGSLEGITIIVGDGTPTPSETQEPTQAPTQAPTQEPTQAPTQAGDKEENKHDKGYEWSVEDATFDPANPPKNNIIQMTVNVWNDPGTSGCTIKLTVDGKEFSGKTADGFPFEIALMKKGTAYASFTQFTNNPDSAEFADATASSDGSADVAAQGGAAATIAFKLKDGAELTPGTKYEIGFAEDACGFSNADKEALNPILTPGYLIIAGEQDTTEPSTQEPTQATTQAPTQEPTKDPGQDPTQAPTQAPTKDPGTTPDKYIYGDVNKNGKVELVDIVMLNRYLTGYDNQDLDDYQTVVANCSRSGETDAETTKENLNGQDSIEILKYLIGLVDALPNNAA